MDFGACAKIINIIMTWSKPIISFKTVNSFSKGYMYNYARVSLHTGIFRPYVMLSEREKFWACKLKQWLTIIRPSYASCPLVYNQTWQGLLTRTEHGDSHHKYQKKTKSSKYRDCASLAISIPYLARSMPYLGQESNAWIQRPIYFSSMM